MRISTFNENVMSGLGQLALVHDWYTMSVVLGTQPHVLSYVKKFRPRHTRRIRLGKRIVYKSSPQLQDTQRRIRMALAPVCEALPDNSHMLAYRKGVRAIEVLKENAQHCDVLIKFDIKGYFDHVRRSYICESLMKHTGMSRGGANLMAFYTVEAGNLQQGSECSPVISNIVGYDLIDTPCKEFLTGYDADIRYYRYCDNIYLFIHGEEPEGFYAEFKAHVTNALSGKLRTHKWSRVSKTNPCRNMSCLGVVCNEDIKLERGKFDLLRAEFFNFAAAPDIAQAILAYRADYGIPNREHIPLQLVESKVLSVLRGKINYVASTNEKQGRILKKLYAVIAKRCSVDNMHRHPLDNSAFIEMKKYRNHEETVDVYLPRVIAA